MPEQASNAQHADHALRMISDAAARYELGRHRGAYPVPRLARNFLRNRAIAAGIFGVLAVVLAVSGVIPFAIMSGVVAVPALFAVLKYSSVAQKNEGSRLDLFERGLTVAYRGEVRVFRYDTTSVLQNIVRHLRNGVHTHTTYEYTLTDVAGVAITLRGAFANPTEWGPAIQRAVTDAQLPGALAAVNAGERLVFGDIWVTRQDAGSGRKRVSWPQVTDVKVKNGYVTLKVAGKWLGLTTTPVRSIPNFFVFLTLAEHLRASSGGGR